MSASTSTSSTTSSSRKLILTVGSINADIFIDIDRLPHPGETLSASRPDTGHVLPGGKGANQAVAVAKLIDPAASSTFTSHWAGRFGDDAHATMLRRVLKENHVSAELATQADGVPSGQAYILLQKGGQNSIILVGAANSSWPSSLPAPLLNAFSTCALIQLQREIPESVNILVAKAAKSHSVPVVLDLGGEDSPVSSDLLSLVTFLTANETELARASSMKTETDEEVKAAAESIRSKYSIPHVLITLGSRGAMLFTGEKECIFEPAWPVDKVVDTTGAGDCFRGSFDLAFLEGKNWKECMRFASAAAAICIQTKGAMPSMPTRNQVETLLTTKKMSAAL